MRMKRYAQRGLPAAVALVALLVAGVTARAADENKVNAKLLSLKSWRENSYGLTLHPPLGYHVLEQNMDDALVRLLGPRGDVMNLYIKKSSEPIGLKEIETSAVAQVASFNPTAVLLVPPEDKAGGSGAGEGGAGEVGHPRKIGGAPGILLYYRIPSKKGFWVLGQGFMQISPTAVALLQLDVDETKFNDVRPVFEAVLDTLAVESQEKIEKERTALMVNAAAWKKTITAARLKAALVPEQWLRITGPANTSGAGKPGERDVGFMRISQHADKQLGAAGFRVTVQGRVLVDTQAYDTQADFFTNDGLDSEVWSIKTTHRVLKKDEKLDAAATAAMADMNTNAETGVRSHGKITVKRVGAAGNKDFNWDQPGVAPVPTTARAGAGATTPPPFVYLSQVELQLLDSLLPHNAPLAVGFYAYSASTGKVSFRTERVEPRKDGSCLVYSRVSPEQPEQVTRFDAKGKLVDRTLPGGQTIVPTTEAELKARKLIVQ
jgi:hypothetical protein